MRIPKNTKPLTVLGMLVLVAVIYAIDHWKGAKEKDARAPKPAPEAAGEATDGAIEGAIRTRRSGVVGETRGEVVKLLPDDREGSRHQRFLLRLPSGHTVLVAHNIDLAPKIPLQKGGRIRIRGQFEWNAKGGVIHWTHHDPRGRRPGGWIDWEGKRYE